MQSISFSPASFFIPSNMGASVLDMSALRSTKGQSSMIVGSSSSAAGSDGSLTGSINSYEGGTGGVRKAQGLRVGVPEALAGLYQSSSKLQTLLGGGAAASSASGGVYPQSPTHLVGDDSRNRGRTLSSGNNSKVQLGAFSDDNDDEDEDDDEEDYDEDNNNNNDDDDDNDQEVNEGLLLDGDVTGSQDPQAELRARLLAASMQPNSRPINRLKSQEVASPSAETGSRGLTRLKTSSSINDTTLESYFESSLDDEVPEF
jgi:hypothetical protein